MKGAALLLSIAFVSINCASTNQLSSENGAIYGWIVAGTDNARITKSLPSEISVKLAESNKAPVLVQTNAINHSGAFYVSDLAPGKYTITSNAYGLTNGKVYDVEVSTDSLTYVVVYMEKVQEGRSGREGFVTTKVGNSNPNDKGSLQGTVKLDGKEPGREVTIRILGTMYVAKTDSSGFFRLDDIIAGTYDISSTFRTPGIEREQYRLSGSAEAIIISKDSTSTIEIALRKSFTGFHLN